MSEMQECAAFYCDEEYEAAEMEETADGLVCPDCAECYTACTDCGIVLNTDENMHCANGDYNFYCRNCIEKTAHTCNTCAAYVMPEHAEKLCERVGNYWDHVYVCPMCVEGLHLDHCAACDALAAEKSGFYACGAQLICFVCIESVDSDEIYRCDDCGALHFCENDIVVKGDRIVGECCEDAYATCNECGEMEPVEISYLLDNDYGVYACRDCGEECWRCNRAGVAGFLVEDYCLDDCLVFLTVCPVCDAAYDAEKAAAEEGRDAGLCSECAVWSGVGSADAILTARALQALSSATPMTVGGQ